MPTQGVPVHSSSATSPHCKHVYNHRLSKTIEIFTVPGTYSGVRCYIMSNVPTRTVSADAAHEYNISKADARMMLDQVRHFSRYICLDVSKTC